MTVNILMQTYPVIRHLAAVQLAEACIDLLKRTSIVNPIFSQERLTQLGEYETCLIVVTSEDVALFSIERCIRLNV